MQARPVPFARSYWVEPGRLLAGHYPGDPQTGEHRRKLVALHAVGVRCIVNLMEPHEVDHDGRPFNPYEDEFRRLAAEAGGAGRCLRFPIRDVSVPSPAAMRGILDAIDLALDAGQPVYLHCWGGRGRTGTVVGCWLVRHNLATAASALDQIQRLRAGDPTAGKPSPETAAQRQMVTTWAAGR